MNQESVEMVMPTDGAIGTERCTDFEEEENGEEAA